MTPPMTNRTVEPGRPRPYIGPLTGKKVGVVGDSITASAVDELEWFFAGHRLSVNAVPGIGMQKGYGLDLVEGMLGLEPDVLVVELGVNNLGDAWDRKDYAQMDTILRAVADVHTVVWVVPGAMAPGWYDGPSGTTLQHRIVLFRNALMHRVTHYPNVTVANFAPSEMARRDWFAADGLHLSAKGRAGFAQFVYDRVTH